MMNRIYRAVLSTKAEHNKVFYIPPIAFNVIKLLELNPTPLPTTSLYDVSSINCTGLITSVGLGPVTELPVYLSAVISISTNLFPFSFCHLMFVTLRNEVYNPVTVRLVP